MLPFLRDRFGNAASRSHSLGWFAEEAVEQARDRVATLIGARPREIIWTSGATESNNLAINGTMRAESRRGNHVVTQATEHKAVLDPVARLANDGVEATILGVDREGRVDPAAVENAITDRTVLVSIMVANNEVGAVQAVAEIGEICRRRGVTFHADAAQAAGRIPLDVDGLNVDLLSISGHKMYGPKGVGALFVRRRSPRVRCEAILHGGGHERGLRSGTLNVPGVVGLGSAAMIAQEEMPEESARLAELRNRLESGLLDRLSGVTVNGSREHRLPNLTNMSFQHVEGEALMTAAGELAVSSGSACTSGSIGSSHVLRALGVEDELAPSSIRFSVGRFTTSEDIDWVVDRIVAVVERLRDLSPFADVACNTVGPIEHHT